MIWMETITVKASRPYNIFIGAGILDQCGPLLREVKPCRSCAVVSDTNVAPLYAKQVTDSLEQSGYRVSLFTFSAGEMSKNHMTLLEIYQFLAKSEITRGDVVAALGGGVCTDMAGFAAATYLRGVDYLSVPTSIMAQVDTAVGGKTAVDTSFGKNTVGAFHQPRLVVCDTGALSTLSPRYRADGMAEVIKYGVLQDPALFARLENDLVAGVPGGEPLDPGIISRCIDIKREAVEADEQEQGSRMLLNLGHTLGHALEKYYEYAVLGHGEAVAVGMVLISRLGETLGITAPGTAHRIAALARRWGLPDSDPAPVKVLAQLALGDKKRSGGDISLIFPRKIGQCIIKKMSTEAFLAACEAIG